MSKLLILLLMFGLLFNGCNDNSQQKNNFNIDTEAPVQPRVIVDGDSTFARKAELKVSGEPEGAVIVDGKIVGEINEDGTATVKLPLSGADGLKEIKIVIEDAYGNRSEPTIVKVYKDTTPPKLQLLGDKTTTLEVGEKFVEPGFSVKDNLDSNAKVAVTGNVNSTMVDNAGNKTVKVRKVIVKEKEITNNLPQYNGSLNNIDANDSQSITIDV